MRAIPVENDFYVAGQIGPDDIETMARAGVTAIINNRPDGEEPGQMAKAEASGLCERHGMTYQFVPVTAETMDRTAVEAFADALKAARDTGGAVVAHCRSGTRSIHLWAMAEVHAGRQPDEVAARVAAAGYDPNGVIPRLQAIVQGRF